MALLGSLTDLAHGLKLKEQDHTDASCLRLKQLVRKNGYGALML